MARIIAIMGLGIIALLTAQGVYAAESDGCNCLVCCDTTYAAPPLGWPEGHYIAHEGSLKVLVVFVRLNEDTTDYENHCRVTWQTGKLPCYADTFIVSTTHRDSFPEGSLNDYYWKMSTGKYFVYGAHYPEVVVTDSANVDLYPDLHRGSIVVRELLSEIAADTDFDFTEFDVDNDGAVDRIILIWRSGPFNSYATLFTWGDPIETHDEVEIHGTFGVSIGFGYNLADALAVTAHELYHQYGYPDTVDNCFLYSDFYSDREQTFYTGPYGVTSALSRQGMCMNAFERHSLCWGDVDTVSSDVVGLKIPDTVTSGKIFKVYIRDTVEDSSEFFLIENRHPDASYYSGQDYPARCATPEGGGLLIWHVDLGHPGNAYSVQHKRGDLESAWGLFGFDTNLADPFYGKDGLDSTYNRYHGRFDQYDFFSHDWNSTFAPYTNPSSNGYYWDATETRWEQTSLSGISITNIRAGEDDTILVDIHFDQPADTIKHDTDWAEWVILAGDIVIPDGVVLTIGSGAVVSAAPDTDCVASGEDTDLVEIIVKGDFVAFGGVSDPIVFRPAGVGKGYSPQTNDWFGLRFVGDGGDTLRYCDVGYAYSGIGLWGQFADPDTTLINNCVVHDNLYAGIECIRSHAVIESTVIDSNGTDGGGSIGLYVYHCNARVFRDSIRGNLPYNYYSIAGDVDSGWVARIEDCFISGEGKTDDDDAYGIVLSRGFADGSIISNSSVNKNSQTGVSLLYNWGFVDIDGCTIKKNYRGVFANRKVTQLAGTSYVEISNSSIKNNTVGVQVSNVPRAYVNLGDTTAGTGGSNNFTLNTTHAANAGNTTQMAEDNWWGASPPVAAKIVGSWDYDPWKTSEVQMGPRRPRQDGTTVFMAYPNPTSGMVAVQLSLPHACHVKFAVYDITGRLVRIAFDGRADQGTSRLVWDGADDHGIQVGAGVYFCRVESGSESKTTKVVMLK